MMNAVQKMYHELEVLKAQREERERDAVLARLHDPNYRDLLDQMSEAEVMMLGAEWETNALIEEACFGSTLTDNRYYVQGNITTSPLRSCSYDACFGIELIWQLERLGMKVYARRPIKKKSRYAVSAYPLSGGKGLVACEDDSWLVALCRCALVAMKRLRGYRRDLLGDCEPVAPASDSV